MSTDHPSAAAVERTIRYKKPDVLPQIGDHPKTVIAASAGTGKTHTLEHLVLDLVLGGMPLERILVVTFTRRAAAEMSIRIRSTLDAMIARFRRSDDADADEVWTIGSDELALVQRALNDFDKASISTIHAFCQRLLAEHAFENKQLFALDQVDESELIEDCFYDVLRSEIAADKEHMRWLAAWLMCGRSLDDLVGDLKTLHSRSAYADEVQLLPEVTDPQSVVDAVNLDTWAFEPKAPPDWKIRNGTRARFFDLVVAEVDRRKRADGLYAYADMLGFVADALHSSDEMVQSIRQRFDVALVDEFQDTDPLQWSIFERAFVDGGDKRVFLIGDEKQSIYSFRGADLNIYRDAVAGAHRCDLAANYRSTEHLIDAYNAVFASGFFSGDFDYTPVQPAPEPHLPRRRWPAPHQSIELLEASFECTPTNPYVTRAYVTRTADEIETILDERPLLEVDDGSKRWLEPGDIYVLTLTNREADLVGEALRERHIPFSFYRKPGLFETDAAGHILDLLAAIADPGDRSARRKTLIGPFFAIPMQRLEEFDEGDAHSFGPRSQLLSWRSAAGRRAFEDLFERIMTESGIRRRELLLSASERRLTNYEHIFEWLTQRAQSRHLDLTQLTEDLRAKRDGYGKDVDEEGALQRLETDRSAVQIMTVHKSKGLQTEVVFVCGGFTQAFPYSGKPDSGLKAFTRLDGQAIAYDCPDDQTDHKEDYVRADRAERERLFYVAITRAKAKVYLPYLPDGLRVMDNGSSKNWKIIPLFEGLDPIVEQIEAGSKDYKNTCLTQFEPDEPDQPTLDRAPGAGSLDLSLPGSSFPSSPADFYPASERGGYDVDQNYVLLPDQKMVDRRLFSEIADDVRQMGSYSKYTPHSSDRGETVVDERFGEKAAGGESTLPGGISAGDCIHHVFEELDYTHLADFDTHTRWLAARPDDSDLIAHALADHYFDVERYHDYLARVCFDTLRTPLRPVDGPDLGRICDLRLDDTRREVRFVIPTPQLEDGPRRSERGYLQGFIDLMFQGPDRRFYFADWKSDSRMHGERFDSDTLIKQVQRHYRVQAGVYSLAMLELLGITDAHDYRERIGGFFYFFVRGMHPADEPRGYYFERPTYGDVHDFRKDVEDAQNLAAAFELPMPTLPN